MSEVRLESPFLRETTVARIWAPVVTLLLLALLPFVYANIWAATFDEARGELASFQPGRGVWLAFAVLQVANKVPVAYRHTAGPAVAAFDLLGLCAGLAAVVAVGTGLAVPTGPVRSGWLLIVAGWLIASVWHQLNPHGPHNRGVARWRRLYCAVVATLIPGLPFVLAVLLAPAA
jgi:hypothetical protein